MGALQAATPSRRLSAASPVGSFSFGGLIGLLAGYVLALSVIAVVRGGPAGQTNVPGLLVYRLAFNESRIGDASALAVVLTVLVVVIVTGHDR